MTDTSNFGIAATVSVAVVVFLSGPTEVFGLGVDEDMTVSMSYYVYIYFSTNLTKKHKFTH